MRILFLFIFLITLTSTGFASVVQPSCAIPSYLDKWTLYNGDFYIEKTKDIPVNQLIKSGDIVAYFSFTDAVKKYISEELIEINDKSPLNPNSKIKKGATVEVVGVLTGPDNNYYEVIKAAGGLFTTKYIPIKSDGYLCSNQIDRKPNGQLVSVGMPIVKQHSPLEQILEEKSKGHKRSVAIVFEKAEGVIIKIKVSLIIDGEEKKTITKGFDMYSGEINIGSLSFKFKKEGSNIRLISVAEPDDYYSWIGDVF